MEEGANDGSSSNQVKNEEKNETTLTIDVKNNDDKNDQKTTNLLYSVTDVPPWYTCFILGLQVSNKDIPL